MLSQTIKKKVKVPTGIRLLIRRCCHAVLELENFEGSAEVSVRFVDNEEIRRLNAEYRNIDRETDVLSFPLGENGVYDVNLDTGAKLLGDIVISMEKAMEQAELYNHPLQREIGFLTVHSMLHLLGYDHENGGIEAVHMREKEKPCSLKSAGKEITAIIWETKNDKIRIYRNSGQAECRQILFAQQIARRKNCNCFIKAANHAHKNNGCAHFGRNAACVYGYSGLSQAA